MSQVKLIVCEGYGSEQRPFNSETGAVIDLNVNVPDTHDILAVVRSDFDVDEDGSRRSNDAIDPVVRIEKIGNLVGRLRTLVDSMFSDPKQRKAANDLFTQAAYDWYHGQTDFTVDEIWRKDRFPKTAVMQKQELEEVFVKSEA